VNAHAYVLEHCGLRVEQDAPAASDGRLVYLGDDAAGVAI